MTLSVNEEEVESIETGYSIQQILNGGTDGNVSGYIGKSLYSPDPAFRGKLKSFKICAEKKDNSDEGKLQRQKNNYNFHMKMYMETLHSRKKQKMVQW